MDTWIIENANDVQVILFFALFALFALAEVIEPKREGPMKRKARWLTNMLLTTINVVVLSLLPVTFFSVAVMANVEGIGLFNYVIMPVLVVGTLLARGFISFFTHYLMHKVPLFWRMHQVQVWPGCSKV